MDHQRSGTTGQLSIDLGAVAANFQRLDQQTPRAEVAAVVKADAYGLGLTQIAPALSAAGCRTFYVAEVGEAAALRTVLDSAEPDQRPSAVICVLAGAQAGTVDDLLAANAVPVLLDPGQLQRWSAASDTEPLPCALHLDTGMARTGFDQRGIEWLREQPAELAGVSITTVLSHLACADEPEHEINRQQLERFFSLRQHFPLGNASLANSAGIALGVDYHADQVRPGLGLYGVEPTPTRPLGVMPVVTLRAPVVQVRTVDAGDTVGYGASHQMAQAGQLAVLGVGYGDGVPRSLSNSGEVSISGQRAPIVGRVSMDLTVVDISRLPAGSVQPGDSAELFGGEVNLNDVADAAGTIAYELLTNLGRRYQRIYHS